MRIRSAATLMLMLTVAALDRGAAQKADHVDARRRALDMFARSYYPGRSGQILIVPREGSVIVPRRDPALRYMHGSPWDYDARIPVLFYGPPYIRGGVYSGPARQQDVMPTLAAVLGAPAPPTVTGRVLAEAIGSGAPPVKAVFLGVLDGMRLDYFERYASLMPTLSRLRRQGAWFANARVDYLPTITGPGHATVATGADPRVHGTTGNSMFDRVNRRAQDAFAGNSPRDLMALTLADVWNLHTRGRAVIIAQGSSAPASVGLAGHGACLFSARPIRMASYNRQTGEWTSNSDCYLLPDYVKQRHAREVWEAAGGTWMGHDIARPDSVRRTSLFGRYETDTLLSMIERESVGSDDVADLMLANLKTPDFVGHQYGPDALELKETLAELDRQITRILATLDRRTGGRYVVALTADHGMPEEPTGSNVRVFSEDIVKTVHDRFDPDGKLVLHYEPENSQLTIDHERLVETGHTLAAIARFLESQPYIFAAFTEDEVRLMSIGPG